GCICGMTVPSIAANASATLSTIAKRIEQNSAQTVSTKSRRGRLSRAAGGAAGAAGRAGMIGLALSVLSVRCAIVGALEVVERKCARWPVKGITFHHDVTSRPTERQGLECK